MQCTSQFRPWALGFLGLFFFLVIIVINFITVFMIEMWISKNVFLFISCIDYVGIYIGLARPMGIVFTGSGD